MPKIAMTDDADDVSLPARPNLSRRLIPAGAYALYAGAAGVGLSGLAAGNDRFLVLSGAAALGVCVVALGLRRHYAWAHSDCRDLDEREQRMRARAYEFSYGALSALVFLTLVVPALISEDILPQRGILAMVGAFGFLLLGATLPTATLAWRDHGPAGGGVGPTGRLSRRTLWLWGVFAAAGLAAGIALGLSS